MIPRIRLADDNQTAEAVSDRVSETELDRSWAVAMPTELQERATSFLASTRVFGRSEFATAVGLPKGADAVVRPLWRQIKIGRIKRAAHEVYAVAWDQVSPGRFVVPGPVIASRPRTDAAPGHQAWSLPASGIP